MNCPKCEKEMRKEVLERVPFPESGLADLILMKWPTWTCACGVAMPEIKNPEIVKDYIVRDLILLVEPLDGDAILFLRKRMGFTGARLASAIGVNRVEVSRWENDAVDISPHYDLKIRLEAIENLVPVEFRDRMKLGVLDVMHRLYKPDAEAEEIPLRVTAAAAAAGELAFA
jgi:transcriptional regulator with XRE-family HTH domain